MIAWWSFPLICTMLAVVLVIWAGFFSADEYLAADGTYFKRELDYKEFLVVGLAFIAAIVCSAVWTFAFILKAFTGQ